MGMKRILLLAAVALTACNQGPVDDSVANQPASTVIVAAPVVKAAAPKVVGNGLDKLSNAELTKRENACIMSDSDTCETPIDAEWHRRGWCAYDATGARKPNCTKEEIDDDIDAEAQLDNVIG